VPERPGPGTSGAQFGAAEKHSSGLERSLRRVQDQWRGPHNPPYKRQCAEGQIPTLRVDIFAQSCFRSHRRNRRRRQSPGERISSWRSRCSGSGARLWVAFGCGASSTCHLGAAFCAPRLRFDLGVFPGRSNGSCIQALGLAPKTGPCDVRQFLSSAFAICGIGL